MNSSEVHVGIDVSKHSLDIDPFDGKAQSVTNTARGVDRLIRRIKQFPANIFLCCEATGGYEKLLVKKAFAAGIPIAVANPKRVRDFARSKGILAKTDDIDKKVISLFSEQNRPHVSRASSPNRLKMKALLTRRSELAEIKKQEASRLDPPPMPEVTRMIKSHIRSLEKQIEKLEELLAQVLQQDDELSLAYARLIQVKGLGPVTVYALLAFMPELGHITDNQASALAGLAPYNDESGLSCKPRSIYGGRKRIRNALYMCSLTAKTYNPVLKPFYQRLVDAGKPKKVALTAVMRKLVVLANRIMSDPEFCPA